MSSRIHLYANEITHNKVSEPYRVFSLYAKNLSLGELILFIPGTTTSATREEGVEQ
jgi:hypothetical protein